MEGRDGMGKGPKAPVAGALISDVLVLKLGGWGYGLHFIVILCNSHLWYRVQYVSIIM